MLDTKTLAMDQSINTLTIADLQALITSVVRQVLREEMIVSVAPLPSRGTLPDTFLATFGSWQDDRSAEEIAQEIIESRTVSGAEVTL